MKTKFYALLVLLALCSFAMAADTCPTGMRKLYLDEESALPYGVARNEIPAITFYEGNGALWYNRRVLVEPRFEVHLKASIDPVDVLEDTDEQIIEGFTIVISSQNNKVGSGTGEYIGYSGFTKSFIVEFDFNKNTNDVDTSSYSFKYCDSACTNDDSKAIYKGKLSNQRFDATKTMNWDFRLIYNDGSLKVYSGPNDVLYEYKVDLADKLGTTIPYVGFTGYQHGNRRELSLLGTFICEDNYDITKLKGKFVVDGEKVETASYKAGNKIYYSFSFINNKDQIVPHCFKTNVWSYSFSLSIDCKSSYEISKIDDYYLLMTFEACSEIGEHTIGLKEETHGSGPNSYYQIVPDGLKKITLIGHDGKIIDLSSWATTIDYSTGAKVLKYGDMNGDFSYKEGLTFVLDFSMTDQYGNSIDLGSTADEILSASGMKLVNSQNAKYSLQKYSDHYQFVLTVTAIGTYRIYKNSYMEDSYEVIVGSADVDSSKSYCTLDGYYWTATVKPDTKLTYSCYFYDSFGNKITYSEFKSNSEYEFSCNVKRTSPSSADYTSTFTQKDDYVVCSYTASDVGVYKFQGLFNKKKSTTKTEITGRVNTFQVSSTSYYLEGAKIYNPYTWSWVDIEGATISLRNDWSGLVTAIDLADASGTVLRSTLGDIPSDFDFSTVTAYITSTHDSSYKVQLYAKKYYWGSYQYVGFYVASDNKQTYELVKKNSYDYKIVFQCGEQTKTITYNYIFESSYSIGNYTTCFHDLDLSKTITSFKTVELAKGGETYVGTITLQTKDNQLYNYDIGKDKIVLSLKDSSADSGFSYRIVTDTVNGVYHVYVTATKEFTSDIIMKINSTTVNTYSGQSTALTESCYMQLTDTSLYDYQWRNGQSYYYTYTGPLTDGGLKFYFRLYDRFGNQISAQDFYKTNTDISCNQFSSTDTSIFKKITYDKETDSFVFQDNISGSTGKYEWVFTTNDDQCNNKTVITYDKSTAGAEVSIDNSYGKLVNTEIKTGEYAYVDVTLNNFNGENIGQVENALNNNIGKVQVIAYYNKNKSSVYFDYDQITGGQTIRFKKQINEPEDYIIVVKYNNKEIRVDGGSSLTVQSREIDFSKSTLKMYADKTISMEESVEVTVDNTVTTPYFRLMLNSTDGVAVTNYENSKKVEISGTLADTNGNTWELKDNYKKSSSGDYVELKFDSTTQSNFNSFRKDHYTLTITKDGESKTFKIYLLGNGDDDASNAKEYDNSKTEYSTTKIEGEAGVTYTVNVEFRDKDGLRWGYVIETSKLSYSNSLKLSSDKLTVTFQKGSKNGQFIINVMQKTATEGSTDNQLTISYNKQELNKEITLSIKASKVSQLIYESGCEDGDVENLPVLKFIPKDKYGNVVYSLFSSTDSDLQTTLNSYTVGKSTDGFTLTTNNYLSESKYVCVQYGSTLPTTVQVTSNYFSETYTYKIGTGPIDADHSYAQLLTSGAKTAGGTYIVMIYPLDKYENELANVDSEYLKKFEVYFDVDREGKYEITSTCKLVEGKSNSFDVEVEGGTDSSSESKVYNQIKCETPITTAGRVEFHVEFSSDEITCRSCIVSVVANNLDIDQTKTVYVNKNTEMVVDKYNEVEVSTLPTWKVLFRDQYGNVITDTTVTDSLKITVKFGDVNIRLCVTEENYYKLVNVCPAANGDDNMNKWYYLINGDNYFLNVTVVDYGKFDYKIKLIGGDSDGSSAEVDLDKAKIEPSKLSLVAGEEGSATMTLYSIDGKRWNYWYPSIGETIKIKFTQDESYCTSTVVRGEKPGIYKITVSCTKSTTSNTFKAVVNGTEISQKVSLEILAGNSYTLEVVDTSKFTVTNNQKTYTFKENPTNDETVSWQFKLKDKYENVITKTDLDSSKTTVKSELYGTDSSYYEVKYGSNIYTFNDKITKAGSKITWVIVCEESSNKYTFVYTKVPGNVDNSQSSYTVDKTSYIVKETSYVEVTLKDSYGFNVGETDGRLSKEKDNVVVQTKGSTTVKYEFDSVTNSNTLKYKYTYTSVGTYEISVTYNSKTIKPDVTTVTVTYQEISGDKSKLYINKQDASNTETVMTTTTSTTVNNTIEYPFYKYVLYTEKGEKITTYDKTIEATSTMKFGDNTWKMTTTKSEEYIKFEYVISKDEFAHLPTGEYTLVVTVSNVTKEYKVYLLGEKGSEGNSPSPNYDITQSEVVKTRIEGIVGEKYSFYVQLKASDRLNWNYLTNPSSVSVSNSYGLASKYLQINKLASSERGRFTVEFIQYVVSTESNPNLLTISYQGKTIPVQVEVIMKHGKLAELIYVDGLRDGTVEDLPVLRFIPVDSYNNTFTELFDSSVYTTEELQKLTKGSATGSVELTSNNYVSDSKYLNVQYITKAPTTITVTSEYFKETYTYDITAGKVDAEKTYAELVQKETSTAGDSQTVVIYPKDANGNTIDFLAVEEREKFVVIYKTETKEQYDISKTCKIVSQVQSTAPTEDGYGKEYNKIQCTTTITIAGKTEFHVEYVDDSVECKKCTVTVNPGEIDFSKIISLYKNTNTYMKTEVTTQVSAQSLPTFVLTFYDKYWNYISDETKVKNLVITTEFTKSDIELCVTDSSETKLSNVCSSSTTNVNKWYYLVNGDSYKFVVYNKDQSESRIFPVEIVNGYKKGSSDAMDIDKTHVEPTSLTIVAGNEGKISLELRTSSEERKNYFFEKTEESIKITFEKDKDTCSYSVVQGTEPGQYTIKVKCTKKEDSNKVTIYIEEKEVSQKVDLKIIPGAPDHSKLYTLKDEEITQKDLGEVKVTEHYQFKEVLYDKYDNLITDINFSTDELGVVFGPVVEVRVGTTYSHNEIPQTNGQIIIDLQSTLAGKHKVIGTFFPLDAYYVTFVHGDASEKSILEVDKTVITAGETVVAYIIPYDKYGNLIDANIYKDSNPYTVSYKTETSNVYVKVEKYEIRKITNYTVIAYDITLIESGETTINGKVEETSLNNRVVIVNPAEMDFLHSKVYRYEASINGFETLRNGTIEKNNETEPIYRLYPYDQYDNSIEYISEEKLKKLESYLNSNKERTVFYYLKLNNEQYTEQKYAEFVIDDSNNKNEYKNLVGGYYDLVFTDKTEKLLYNITLGNSKEGSNEDADIQKTYVTPEKIQFTAGETGEMYVEIRTSSNVIKNSWEGYTIKVESCDSSDTTFKYEQEKAGRLGMFLVTITTEKANTFPSVTECKLKIYVNNELVNNAQTLLEVSPGAPYTSQILEQYWKESTSSKVLKDGTADSNYVFEVKSYDKYGNLCETKQEIVGITISLLGNTIKTTTSFTESSTGYRKFTVPTSGAGVYTITSSINSNSNSQYLPNDSTFTIYAGEIDLSKVIVKERETVIKAGEKAEIAILAFDKNGNSIAPDDFKDKFTVVFNDANNEKHETTNAANTEYKQVIYTSTAITVIGYVKTYVTYNVSNKSVDTSHISILVVSAEPDATNSILSRLTTSNTITTYKNGDNIPCNVKSPPVFNITLYDKYNNYISTISSDVSIVEPTMSGNDMTEIVFDVTNKNSYFNLDFNSNSNALKIYSRLVKGNYEFTYDVKTSSGSSSFKYTIVLEADNDEYHGNGAIEKLVISPTDATMYAGDYSYFTLELRTKKDLLYNDEVDTSSIKITLNKEEKSFSYSVTATKTLGNFTISIYCEKKGQYTYTATVESKTSNTISFKVLPQLIPYPPYTEIITKPDAEITYDTKIVIEYKLADKFNNVFDDRVDLVDGSLKYSSAELYVVNNNQTVTKATQELLTDGQTFKTTFDPIWPPLTMVINTVFHDSTHSFDVFEKDIITKIKTVIEYDYTIVESTNAITIYVGEILDMRLYLYDNLNLCLEEVDYSDSFEVVVNGPLNSVYNKEKVYKVHKVTNNEVGGCQNKYEIITTEKDIYTKTGQYHIDVYGGEKIIKSYNQTCLTTGYDKSGFTFEYLEENFNDSAIVVGDTVTFKITGRDKYGNLVNEPLKDDLKVYLTSKEGKTVKYDLDSVEYINGEVTYRCTVYTTGHLPVNLEYKEEKVTKVNIDLDKENDQGEDLPTWLVHNGPCYAYDNEHFDLSNFTDSRITLGRKNTFKFKCYDYYNNSIDYGGEIFHADCNYVYNSRQSSIDAEVEDENTGYYYVTFVPTNYGKHIINLQIERKNNGQEKYGEEIVLNLEKYECPNGQILCPNSNSCVNNLVSCIYPPNSCPSDKPFECKVNGVTTCVASQTDCDCPDGYIRCDYMHYCVPEDRPDMCASTRYSNTQCRRVSSNYKLFADGKCRDKTTGQTPNQKVCPIGKVLCADLSCRDSYPECLVSDYCGDGESRCPDQTCQFYTENCPNTITCEDSTQYVCNNDVCVDSELECEASAICDLDPFTNLCDGNFCASSWEDCPKKVSCGHGKSLCSDNVCRDTCP